MKRVLQFIVALIIVFIPFSMTWAQQGLLPLPPHQSLYTMSNAIRGYYFIAPTNFTITGTRVPSEAGTGLQNIHIVRLPAIPPTFGTTTFTYTTLFNVTGAPNGVIQTTNIQVNAGDVIGVLGNSTWGHSYGPTAPVVNWFGQNVTLYRFGSQSYPTADVWTEASSIARVELYVSTCESFDIRNNPVICQGDSVRVGNKIYKNSGVYVDSFKTVNDCDSIITTTLTVNPVYTTYVNDSIYSGQTYNFNGFDYGVSGNYTASFSTVNGCDSSTILRLKVIPFKNDTFNLEICSGDTAYYSSYAFTRSGIYRDTVMDDWGHIFRTFVIKVNPKPTVKLNSLVDLNDLCIGDTILLNLTGADTFKWHYADKPFNRWFYTGKELTTRVFGFETNYYIEAITDKNCKNTAEFSILGKDCCTLLVPNAFSPNNDGLNDYFEVLGMQPQEYNIEIYDRYGRNVFRADKTSAKWDGKDYNGAELSANVYYYIIKGKCFDGSDILKKGDITLIK